MEVRWTRVASTQRSGGGGTLQNAEITPRPRRYRRAGVKPAEPITFLLTDSQIVDEKFLVFINDVLAVASSLIFFAGRI